MMKKLIFLLTNFIVIFPSLTRSQTIYSNDFTGAEGGIPASSAGVDPGINTYHLRTELDGAGHLTSASTLAGDVYRVQLANDPITSPVKLTATVKTPQDTRWIGVGFQGEQVVRLDASTSNSGPWLQINQTSFIVRGGTGNNGTAQTYSSQYTAGSVNTFEMTYYTNRTVDVFLNGSSVVTGLQINHEYPAGTSSYPVIKYLQMQFFSTATDSTEPWIDEVVVEVIPDPAKLKLIILSSK